MSLIYIHANNIHQGGGRHLLCTLLGAIKQKTVLSVDDRISLPEEILLNTFVNRVKPSIYHRFMSELRLAKLTKTDDVVLCFGSLPPLFKLRSKTFVFLQNRYLIDYLPLNEFPNKTIFRIFVERILFYILKNKVDLFIVQTPTMKRLLKKKIGQNTSIQVLPFVNSPINFTTKNVKNRIEKSFTYEFIYVASGEPHKNHLRLIEAWCLLAEDGIFPSLCLTLDQNRSCSLCNWISDLKQKYGLNITNLGVLPHQDLLLALNNSGAAIYPSKFESFGLPLIEARQAGLPILASELDYVRDLIDPDEVFDPDSAISIARAVKRYKGVLEMPLELLDSVRFAALLSQGMKQL